MNAISLQITYVNGQPQAAYISLVSQGSRISHRTEEVAPEIVVDFDAESRPLGVEIVTPGDTTIDEILAVFDHLGITRPDLTDLAPLAAA